MASKPKHSEYQSTNATNVPAIKLWIADEDSLDYSRLGGDTDSDSSSTEENPAPLPTWKNSESQINIKNPPFLGFETWKHRLKDTEEPGIVDDGYDGELSWVHNFKTFTGAALPFTGNPGPTLTSTDPYTIFTQIWDKEIMSMIAEETNRYAREVAEMQRGKIMPDKYVEVTWSDTTVDELYVFFSLFIFMSLQKATLHQILFGCTKLEIPFFPEIMPLERFKAINSCIHFIDNSNLPETNKAVAKIQPILEHCNKKFTALYKPRQFLDIDYSLLLMKEDSAEGIRAQANYIGIRTYELLEVYTGYLLKVLLYPGKDTGIDSKGKAEIVLNLVEEYSQKGHRVVTNRYFSSVYLARLLKSKGFDNIGEVRKTRKDLPQIIQELKPHDINRDLYKYNGNKIRMVSCHCGDLSVVAWSEFDLTALSTYHNGAMRPNKRGIRRPALTIDYCKVREKKISIRDQDLTDYAMMEKSTERWYVSLFKRLLILSIKNSFIIYKCNVNNNRGVGHLTFRHTLANQILDQHGVKERVERARMINNQSNDSDYDDDDDDDNNWSDVDSDDSSYDNECSIM